MNEKPQTPAAKRFERLPAGRHGLDPELVAANQRERLMAAVVEISAEVGYPAVTLEEIVGRASISRRTFYEHFSGKEEAFLAAYDQATAQLALQLQSAAESGETFCQRVYNTLDAAVDFVKAEPSKAMVCLVEVAALGPEGVERRNRSLRRFVTMLDRIAADLDQPIRSPSELTMVTIVGGINEVFYSRLVQDRASELEDLIPDLVYSILLPFIGRERATAQYRTLVERTSVSN